MGLRFPRFTCPGGLADFISAASRYASWSFHTWTRLPGGYHVRGDPHRRTTGHQSESRTYPKPAFLTIF